MDSKKAAAVQTLAVRATQHGSHSLILAQRQPARSVRGIQPGGFPNRAALRRNRPRPCHHPQTRAHYGRRCDGGERAGQRFSVHGAPDQAARTRTKRFRLKPCRPCDRRVLSHPNAGWHSDRSAGPIDRMRRPGGTAGTAARGCGAASIRSAKR
jgi:hypothetical protein